MLLAKEGLGLAEPTASDDGDRCTSKTILISYGYKPYRENPRDRLPQHGL